MGGHRFQMGGPGTTSPPRWRRPCFQASSQWPVRTGSTDLDNTSVVQQTHKLQSSKYTFENMRWANMLKFHIYLSESLVQCVAIENASLSDPSICRVSLLSSDNAAFIKKAVLLWLNNCQWACWGLSPHKSRSCNGHWQLQPWTIATTTKMFGWKNSLFLCVASI